MRTATYVRIAVCTAILFTLLAHTSPAKACSCVADVTLHNNFASHDAVFTGKVVRIVDNYAPYFSTVDYILYRLGYSFYFFDHFVHNDARRLGFGVFFKVINSWKGVEKSFVEVNTGRGGGDCGYTFEMGKEYLVYASYAYGIPDNYWVTGICSRNATLPDATEDLNYLNSLPQLSPKFALPIPWAEKDTITFVLAMVIIGAVAFARRRGRIRRQSDN